MGVYSIGSTGATDFNLDNIAESCYTPDIAGAYAIVAENEANYNSIMRAIGIAELACLESTGVEMVYEAADIKGFFAKIKEFFLSIIEKVKGLVKKFFALIDSYTKSDKDFVNKYKKALIEVSTKGFEYEGFVFSNLDWSPAKANADMAKACKNGLGVEEVSDFANVVSVSDAKKADASDFETIITKFEDADDIREKMRAEAIGASSGLEAGEFSKEIYKYFRSNEDAKQTIDSVNVNELLSIVMNSADAKKKAQKAYEGIEKTIKSEISGLEKAEKAITKLIPGNDSNADNKVLQEYYSKAVSACNKVITLTKDRLNFLQQVNGGLLTAIKDHTRQAKSVCVALLNYKPKNESATISSYSEGGFLSGVKLR